MPKAMPFISGHSSVPLPNYQIPPQASVNRKPSVSDRLLKHKAKKNSEDALAESFDHTKTNGTSAMKQLADSGTNSNGTAPPGTFAVKFIYPIKTKVNNIEVRRLYFPSSWFLYRDQVQENTVFTTVLKVGILLQKH